MPQNQRKPQGACMRAHHMHSRFLPAGVYSLWGMFSLTILAMEKSCSLQIQAIYTMAFACIQLIIHASYRILELELMPAFRSIEHQAQPVENHQIRRPAEQYIVWLPISISVYSDPPNHHHINSKRERDDRVEVTSSSMHTYQ